MHRALVRKGFLLCSEPVGQRVGGQRQHVQGKPVPPTEAPHTPGPANQPAPRQAVRLRCQPCACRCAHHHWIATGPPTAEGPTATRAQPGISTTPARLQLLHLAGNSGLPIPSSHPESSANADPPSASFPSPPSHPLHPQPPLPELP